MKGSTKSLFAVLATVAGIATASAQIFPPPDPADAKIYSGTSCRTSLGRAAADLDAYYYGVKNISSTTTVRVMCPIVRDNTQNKNGTWSAPFASGVYVRVHNPVSGLVTRCTLYSLGTYIAPFVSGSASTNAQGDRTLFLDVNSSTAGGQYNLECHLPPQARLYNYWVNEYRPTDTQ